MTKRKRPLLPERPAGEISVESGVSLFDHIRIDGALVAQVDVAAAREIGQHFYEAAEGAETDAMIFHLVTDGDADEATEQTALQMIQQLRFMREDHPWDE